jgi:hypothetical protein
MAQACVNKAAVMALAPGLTDDAVLDVIVSITCKIIEQSFDIWGDLAEKAHLTLAAHFASIMQSGDVGGPSGAVISRTIDKLSESYAAGHFEDTELGSTKFGRLHLALLASLRTQRAVSIGDEPPDWSLPDRRIV